MGTGEVSGEHLLEKPLFQRIPSHHGFVFIAGDSDIFLVQGHVCLALSHNTRQSEERGWHVPSGHTLSVLVQPPCRGIKLFLHCWSHT